MANIKVKSVILGLFLLFAGIGTAYITGFLAMNIQRVEVSAGEYPLVFLASATNNSYSDSPINLGIVVGNKTLFMQVENVVEQDITGTMSYELQNSGGIDSLTEIEISDIGCSLSGDIISCNETKTFNAGSTIEFEKVITISPYARGIYNISIAIN